MKIIIGCSPQSIAFSQAFSWNTSVFSSCRDNHCQRRQRDGERHSRKGMSRVPCMLVDWTPTAGAGVVCIVCREAAFSYMKRHIHVVPSDIDTLTSDLSTCSPFSARQPLLGRPRNLWKSRQSQLILLVLEKFASRQYTHFAAYHASPQ